MKLMYVHACLLGNLIAPCTWESQTSRLCVHDVQYCTISSFSHFEDKDISHALCGLLSIRNICGPFPHACFDYLGLHLAIPRTY